MYTKEEKIAIVHLYFANNSIRQTRDLFSVQFPDRPIPSISTIHNIIKKFNSGGCVVNAHTRKQKKCHILTEEVELNILCYVEENPIVSTKAVAEHFEISKTSVYRTLKKFNYKAYKFSNHQQLFEQDKITRTNFCETLFNLINNNNEILCKIVFTDEATFMLNGKVNSQNYRFALDLSLLIHFPNCLFSLAFGPEQIHTFKTAPTHSIIIKSTCGLESLIII